MSDEQPPELGSRRRRREIREARERERAAQRERESAVRRLSNSSTADTTSAGRRSGADGAPDLFDQETTTPKDQRRSSPPKATRSGSTRSATSAGSPIADQGFTSRRERRLQTQQQQTVAPAQSTQSAPSSHSAATAEPQEKTQSHHEPATQAISVPPQASPEPAERASRERSAEEYAVPSPAPTSPSASPSTPFEDVVAPKSPASPMPEQPEPAYEYEDHDEFDWDGAYDDEYYDHDENGAPVLVGASGYGRGYQTVAPMEGHVNRDLLMKRRSKRRRRNITLTVALGGFAALMIAFVMILQSLLGGDEVTDYETVAGEEVEFEIFEEEGLASVQNRLVDQGIVASADAFQSALEDLDAGVAHHAGTYELYEQMPAEDAVEVIFAEGVRVGYVNINAGFRLDETLEAVAAGAEIPLEELEELNQNPQQFGLPEQAENLEGFLAAGEYQPGVDASAEDVLQSMVDPTLERLEELGITDSDEQWDTMIVASLITAEANNTISEERTRDERLEDYRIMAGAIENRLEPDQTETDGLLQIDAAVNYGLGLSGDLHFPEEERLNPDNDYNTYVHPGLPPGPIGVPVADTVEAAANPTETDAFYWVTVNPVTGETRFNATLAEHEEDTQEFLQFCQENEGACGPGDVDAAEDELDG